MSEKLLTCLDCQKTDETVEQTTTSDRNDFKLFPRCPECLAKREAIAQRTMNRYPEAFTSGHDDYY